MLVGNKADNYLESGLINNCIKVYAMFMVIYYLFCRYLHEIGYTDTIIDVRSSRVRNLLGINNNNNLSIDQGQGENQLNGNNYNKRFSDNQGQCSPTKRVSYP